jgi:hypothetical protein
LDVGFEARDPIPDLPVVADLGAAKEPTRRVLNEVGTAAAFVAAIGAKIRFPIMVETIPGGLAKVPSLEVLILFSELVQPSPTFTPA